MVFVYTHNKKCFTDLIQFLICFNWVINSPIFRFKLFNCTFLVFPQLKINFAVFHIRNAIEFYFLLRCITSFYDALVCFKFTFFFRFCGNRFKNLIANKRISIFKISHFIWSKKWFFPLRFSFICCTCCLFSCILLNIFILI